MIKSTTNLGVKGEYRIQLKNADGIETYDSGFRPNMVLDNFFQCTLVNDAYLPANGNVTLRVGTGSTPPQPTNTSLQNLLASTTSTSATTTAFTVDGLNWKFEDTTTFRFTLGSVVGALSELGICMDGVANAGATTVHTRALITDINGNPTTVTVTNQDQLLITYKLAIVGTDTDGSGTVTLDGQTYNWTTRRASGLTAGQSLATVLSGTLNYQNAWGSGVTFGAAGIAPTGAGAVGINSAKTNPLAGRIQHTITANIAQGNISGGILVIGGGAIHKIQFSPAIPKDATKVLSLVTEYTLSRA